MIESEFVKEARLAFASPPVARANVITAELPKNADVTKNEAAPHVIAEANTTPVGAAQVASTIPATE